MNRPCAYMRMAVYIGIGLVMAALALLTSGRSAEPAAPPDGPKKPKAIRVVLERVVDGDTVIVQARSGRIRVRLAGIDAPEIAHPRPGRDLDPACRGQVWGPEAKAVLSGLLERQDGFLLTVISRDRYGRALGWLAAAEGREPVNVQLVRRGLAYRYPGPCYPWCDALAKAQDLAREDRRGIWALADPESPPDYRRRCRLK